MKLLHLLTFLLVPISLGGCSSSDLAPLQGRVILSEDSNFAFQGDVIELKLQSDPAQLAYGEIQPDGSFTVESLWKEN